MRWHNQEQPIIPRYNVAELESIDEVKQLFENGPDELNWLFLSTSGVHGDNTTLDMLEANWDEPYGSDNYCGHNVTVLVHQPRLVCSRYGHLEIQREDIPWLRTMATLTIEAVIKSQQGNVEGPLVREDT